MADIPAALPRDRAVGDYRLRSGHRIRLRPDPVGGGWRVDLWSLAGTAILAGEPLVVTPDLWAQYRPRGVGFPDAALRVEGPGDPVATAALSDQDIVVTEVTD